MRVAFATSEGRAPAIAPASNSSRCRRTAAASRSRRWGAEPKQLAQPIGLRTVAIKLAGSALASPIGAQVHPCEEAASSALGSQKTGRPAKRPTCAALPSSTLNAGIRLLRRASNSASKVLTGGTHRLGRRRGRRGPHVGHHVGDGGVRLMPDSVTTGTGHFTIMRAKNSSLKGIKSSYDPPPRTTSTTSAPACTTARIPRRCRPGLADPRPQRRRTAPAPRGNDDARCAASYTASPRGLVTRPMVGVRRQGQLSRGVRKALGG